MFDPGRLQEIVEELGGRVMSLGKDPSLKDVRQLLTTVDGTVIKTLARAAEAAHLRSPGTGRTTDAWRLHMQFGVERSLPRLLEVTGGPSRGGRMNAAYCREIFSPVGATFWIVAIRSSRFSMRSTTPRAIMSVGFATIVSTVPKKSVRWMRPRAANVVRDTIAVTGHDRRGSDKPNHKIRIVVVQTRVGQSRPYHIGRCGDPSHGCSPWCSLISEVSQW